MNDIKYDSTCPVCGSYYRDGHADDCEIPVAYEALESMVYRIAGERDDARAETNRLRAEVETETEKRRIVAWIRDQPYQHAQGLADIADAIERGEHRKEKENNAEG